MGHIPRSPSMSPPWHR